MLTEDFYGDSFKWFVGVVKHVNDDKNRVGVRIFGIHHIDDVTNVSDDDLPLALVLYPTTGAQTGGGTPTHSLKPGTWVFGFFADGDDCQQPVIVGVIAGGFGAPNNSTSTYGQAAPGAPGQASDAGSGETTDASITMNAGTINLKGNSNIEKAYNFFREKIESSGKSGGDVHAQVCGILGNLMTESNLNPGSNNPNDKGARAFGIAQWRGDRLQALLRAYGSSPTFEQQLAYVWHELNTSETKARDKLFAASTVIDATKGFCWFERPQCCKRGGFIDTSDGTWTPRLKYAQQVYNTVKYDPRGS